MGGIIASSFAFSVSHGSFVPGKLGLAVFFGTCSSGRIIHLSCQVARQTMISNLPASPAEHEKSGLKKLKEIAENPICISRSEVACCH